MPVIMNTWIEKIRKKKTPETAPAYESHKITEDDAYKKPEKRHTNAARAVLVKTLRGIRK
jgi:hypothetical protein